MPRTNAVQAPYPGLFSTEAYLDTTIAGASLEGVAAVGVSVVGDRLTGTDAAPGQDGGRNAILAMQPLHDGDGALA